MVEKEKNKAYLDIAKQLGYSKEAISKIRKATSDNEITRIMRSERMRLISEGR